MRPHPISSDMESILIFNDLPFDRKTVNFWVVPNAFEFLIGILLASRTAVRNTVR